MSQRICPFHVTICLPTSAIIQLYFSYLLNWFVINPHRVCAIGYIVVTLSVCLSVCGDLEDGGLLALQRDTNYEELSPFNLPHFRNSALFLRKSFKKVPFKRTLDYTINLKTVKCRHTSLVLLPVAMTCLMHDV